MGVLPATIGGMMIGKPQMKGGRMTEKLPAGPDRDGMPEKIGTALGFILVVFVAAELLYAIAHAVTGL
jgi:hypothetical protein